MEAAVSSNAQTACCSVKAAPPPANESKLTPFVKSEGETHALSLRVEGMHCARCIWAIESNLQKEEGVLEARVNLSTARLSLRWQGDVCRADDFAAIVVGLGYQTHPMQQQTKVAPKEETALLRAMAVAGFAMGNIMLISVTLWSSDLEVMGLATRELLHWLSAAIALPTIIYAGRPFFRSALAVLRKGHTNMDVPISLAVILASGMSLFETMRGGEHAYFDSAVMLLFFLLIGRWLDARARGKAQGNAAELLQMLQGSATIIEDGKPRSIAISELAEGHIMRIAAGEKAPTDAEIIEGASEIDTSLVTGESLPREAKAGEVIYGGTLNLNAPLLCRVLKASDDSLLAGIIRLMEQAEQGRARYVRMADKAAQLYTPVVHTLAAAAFVGWLFLGGMAWQDALMIAVTTLIITCPCALGLAVPVVQVLSVSTLMKHGVLVKSGDALERLSSIDTVIFDKTGTLTLGEPRLANEVAPEHLQLAASLAVHSHHPYSKAIAAAYEGELIALGDVKEVAGEGVWARLDNAEVFLGKGERGVVLKRDGETLAEFHFTDPLRPDARETLTRLRDKKMALRLLSGDQPEIVDRIAKELGIEEVQGGLLPNEKQVVIQRLKTEGHKVLMVGDGLNDAPSLAEAHISISPATGVDITQNTADIVFQGESLRAIEQSWEVARHSTRLVKQNFALAVAYNCIAIPLAVAGYVTPLVAAIAMSGSSLIVIANSFRITRAR